jgi:hypothetical protein
LVNFSKKNFGLCYHISKNFFENIFSKSGNFVKKYYFAKGLMKIIKRILKLIFLLALASVLVAFFNKNKLPIIDDILLLLWQDPVQEETAKESFSIIQDDYTAHREPLYEYEQWGLVVADYDSENWLDVMHEHDPFNTKDICLVWGHNIKSDVYSTMKYKHGEFTCFYRTDDWETYRRFNEDGLANNHLLPASEEIYKAIKNAQIGDQVYLKGQLVGYSISGPLGKTGSRNSSTSRTDRGNGACEVIYTSEFSVIKEGQPLWRLVFQYGIYTVLGSLLILIIIFIIELERSWHKKDKEFV